MTIRLPAFLLTFFSLILFSTTVFSHAKSVSSDPAPRSTISHSPEFISILFNQQLEPAYSTITVKNKQGELVTKTPAIVDPKNNKRLVLTLPTLPPGKYTVAYKVLSLDGHVVKSTYTFRLKKEAPHSH